MYLVSFLRYLVPKNGMTLKPGRGRHRSRLLKMAQFDRSYTIDFDRSYTSIVSIALCCTIFQLFDVE